MQNESRSAPASSNVPAAKFLGISFYDKNLSEIREQCESCATH